MKPLTLYINEFGQLIWYQWDLHYNRFEQFLVTGFLGSDFKLVRF